MVIVPTDERIAKLVGAILHDAASGSGLLADAHIAAVCAEVDYAADHRRPDDIVGLATAIRRVRVVTRHP